MQRNAQAQTARAREPAIEKVLLPLSTLGGPFSVKASEPSQPSTSAAVDLLDLDDAAPAPAPSQKADGDMLLLDMVRFSAVLGPLASAFSILPAGEVAFCRIVPISVPLKPRGRIYVQHHFAETIELKRHCLIGC